MISSQVQCMFMGFGARLNPSSFLEDQKGETKMGKCYGTGDSIQALIMHSLSWYLRADLLV